MKLTDFNDLTTFGIEDPRMTTIGGVVFRHLDRLPKVGDKVALGDGLVATVLDMEEHRLILVRIAQGRADSQSEEDESEILEVEEGAGAVKKEEGS
jgi:CBS domain containing-hemolysin-like protein